MCAVETWEMEICVTWKRKKEEEKYHKDISFHLWKIIFLQEQN
jgi:hypothetical protein